MTAGDSATLECTISGSPELKVKWFKDGKEMISGRKYKMTVKENVASMKILAAEKGDTSEYRMELSNKVGKDQCTCSITVLGQLQLLSFIHPFIELLYNKWENNMSSNLNPRIFQVILAFLAIFIKSCKYFFFLMNFLSRKTRSDHASNFYKVPKKS